MMWLMEPTVARALGPAAPPRAWLPSRAWVPRLRSLARLLTYVAIAAAAMVPVRLIVETCRAGAVFASPIPMTEAYGWWAVSVLALALAVGLVCVCRTRRWCRRPPSDRDGTAPRR